jgi:hypothetical protein
MTIAVPSPPLSPPSTGAMNIQSLHWHSLNEAEDKSLKRHCPAFII